MIIDSGLNYEAIPTDFLVKRLDRLDQKIVWRVITPDERKEYALIESVLKMRNK